jgi:hypothetical protein
MLLAAGEPELSEAEILLLRDRVIDEKSVPTEPAPKRPQSPSLRELSLDEILQKIQRDIAEGRSVRDLIRADYC